jgi:hypothetical protein
MKILKCDSVKQIFVPLSHSLAAIRHRGRRRKRCNLYY